MSTTAVRSQARSRYQCTECGWATVKWVGRCGECQAWGTVVPEATTAGPRTAATTSRRGPARPITEVDVTTAAIRPTGVGELDRVLGGGLAPGAVVLVAGEPGVGKSTLLLDIAARAAAVDRLALYVTGEESAGQVRLRADRIGALCPSLLLAAENDLGAVLGHLQGPLALVVVDSIQTVASTEVEGAAGGVNQVREVAAALTAVAKDRGIPVLLVGHVTKDGSVAGPRTLEHLVDVVCAVEGDPHSQLRIIRATKNRYGPTDEVGCFELTESGVRELPDPSGLFLSSAAHDGTCVTIALEGRRPLGIEVQSLLTRSTLPSPRRTTNGIDSARLAMILAVLQRRAPLPLFDRDVYVATVGGARVHEPAADLAIALAVAGGADDDVAPGRLVAIGELGLAGEIRPVTGLRRRLSEAHRLGFRTAIVPASAPLEEVPDGLQVRPAADLRDALRFARENRAQPSPIRTERPTGSDPTAVQK